ncbi:MAG: hypothetical protein AAGU11_01000 [Syntrophobacteraceae bacterium]
MATAEVINGKADEGKRKLERTIKTETKTKAFTAEIKSKKRFTAEIAESAEEERTREAESLR